MSLELRHLRYFLELAQTEHLTQAAQNLFITQSTLSHGLRQLEEEVGAVLFERVGRGLRLSDAGRSLRGYAARALQEVEAGRMALAEIAGLNAGTLRVGTLASFGRTFIPPAVSAFSRRYPRVQVAVRELRGGEIEQMLLEGRLDVGISLCPAAPHELDVDPLFDEALVLVVHADHPLSKRRALPLKALAGVPLAMQPALFVTRRIVDEAFRTVRVTPVIRVEMDSIESLLKVCRDAATATLIPERAAQHAEDLRVIRLHSPTPRRSAGVLWRRGGARNVAALEFVRLLAVEPTRRRARPPR